MASTFGSKGRVFSERSISICLVAIKCICHVVFNSASNKILDTFSFVYCYLTSLLSNMAFMIRYFAPAFSVIVFYCVCLHSESIRVSVGVGRWDEDDDVVDDRVDIIVTVISRIPDCVKPNKVSHSLERTNTGPNSLPVICILLHFRSETRGKLFTHDV